MSHVFIYALKCPNTGDVRYIGKAKNVANRFRAHLNRATEKNHRACWIRSLKAQGLKPLLEVLDEVSEEFWPQWEVAWIAFFREEGADLVNGDDGGEGGHKRIVSGETRRKLSLAGKGKKRSSPMPLETRAKLAAAHTGLRSSVESRAKQSLTRTGRKASPEHCEAIGAAHRGRKQSPAQIAWKLGKPCSPEKRAAISASHLRFHALKRAAKLAAQLLPPSYADNPSLSPVKAKTAREPAELGTFTH